MKWLVALAALVVALSPPPSAANRNFTIDAAMSRGPADAPVTIVEFSDYQ
jgi:protein-disulfide isomerase